MDALEHLAARNWGRGKSIEWYAPSRAQSSRAREGFARWERMAVSPNSLLRMLRMIRAIDVRGVLPAIHVPTLVIQRQDDRVVPPCHGRYLAEHLAQASYFEQPGDHVLWLGDTDAMFTEIEQFLSRARRPPDPDRLLATIRPLRLGATHLPVSELAPEDLAGGRLGQIFDELDLSRVLVRRHALLAERDQILFGGRLALL